MVTALLSCAVRLPAPDFTGVMAVALAAYSACLSRFLQSQRPSWVLSSVRLRLRLPLAPALSGGRRGPVVSPVMDSVFSFQLPVLRTLMVSAYLRGIKVGRCQVPDRNSPLCSSHDWPPYLCTRRTRHPRGLPHRHQRAPQTPGSHYETAARNYPGSIRKGGSEKCSPSSGE